MLKMPFESMDRYEICGLIDEDGHYHGLQLQLPVYLNAAMDLEGRKTKAKEIVPAGIFYYRMQDPLVEKERDDQILETKILKELRLDGPVSYTHLDVYKRQVLYL